MSSVYSCKYPLFYVSIIDPVFRSIKVYKLSLRGGRIARPLLVVTQGSPEATGAGAVCRGGTGDNCGVSTGVCVWPEALACVPGWERDFRRNSEPLGVLTTYDLGSSHFLISFAGLHTLDRVSYMAIVCPDKRSCRSFVTFLSC